MHSPFNQKKPIIDHDVSMSEKERYGAVYLSPEPRERPIREGFHYEKTKEGFQRAERHFDQRNLQRVSGLRKEERNQRDLFGDKEGKVRGENELEIRKEAQRKKNKGKTGEFESTASQKKYDSCKSNVETDGVQETSSEEIIREKRPKEFTDDFHVSFSSVRNRAGFSQKMLEQLQGIEKTYEEKTEYLLGKLDEASKTNLELIEKVDRAKEEKEEMGRKLQKTLEENEKMRKIIMKIQKASKLKGSDFKKRDKNEGNLNQSKAFCEKCGEDLRTNQSPGGGLKGEEHSGEVERIKRDFQEKFKDFEKLYVMVRLSEMEKTAENQRLQKEIERLQQKLKSASLSFHSNPFHETKSEETCSSFMEEMGQMGDLNGREMAGLVERLVLELRKYKSAYMRLKASAPVLKKPKQAQRDPRPSSKKQKKLQENNFLQKNGLENSLNQSTRKKEEKPKEQRSQSSKRYRECCRMNQSCDLSDKKYKLGNSLGESSRPKARGRSYCEFHGCEKMVSRKRSKPQKDSKKKEESHCDKSKEEKTIK